MNRMLPSWPVAVLAFVLTFGPAGAGLAAFVESGGQAVMEAENYTSRSDAVDLPDGPSDSQPNQWLVVPDESAASDSFANARDGAFIQMLDDGGPNGEGNFDDPTGVGPFVDYVVQISTPGVYRLFARWDSPNRSSDSFYVMILDPGGNVLGDVEIFSGNHDLDFATDPWDAATELWNLAIGDYTVRLAPREEGVAVDALILQLGGVSDPVGDGPPESATTDDMGIPDIAVAPLHLSFGAVPPSSSAALSVTVSNVGDGDLNVTGVGIGATSSPAFSLTSAPGLPGTLAPGEMVEVEVTFSPGGTSLETGTLEIASDDPDEPVTLVDLSGSGDAGDLAECLENLGACQASLQDADADGEVDATDRCPNTREGAWVDQAGCAREQFCRRIHVRSWIGAAVCLRSDWRNDEPLSLFPADCRLIRIDHGLQCGARYGQY